MRSFLAMLAGFLLLSCLPSGALAHHLAGDPEVTPAQQPAVNAATHWLADVDAGRYATSWHTAAAHLRQAVDERDWVTRLYKQRAPLGDFDYRAVTRGRTIDLPDGKGIILEFAARFAKRRDVFETVVVVREADDVWRVAGYYTR